MQEQNYFDLPSKEKEDVVQALQSLLEKLEGDDSEEPLMVVQKCADANFAPLPTQYQGVLDKMLAKGSNKKVLGAAQNTFAWDANTKEFVQCIPYSTFRLAQQLDQTDAASTKNIVQRALKTLLGFEQVWKKQTAQLSAITVPTTSADYYIDAKGNAITVNDALGTPGVALNKCETATTAEQCEARLDPRTKDTGGCLWLPYSSHLAGPQTFTDLLEENPCRDVRDIPFPLRPMDKVDEYALAEGKMVASRNYDPATKTMAHTMADATTDRKDYSSTITSAANTYYGNNTTKMAVTTTSALQPQGRRVPYFLGKDGKSVFRGTGKDLQAKGATALQRLFRKFKSKSADLPSNVRAEISRMADTWNAALNSTMVGLTAEEIALEKRPSETYPDLYEWEVKKLDTDDNFVTFAERTARAVYDLARNDKLDKEDVRAIVRVDLESGKRAIVATTKEDKCKAIYDELALPADTAAIAKMTNQERRAAPMLPLTRGGKIDDTTKGLKGKEGGFFGTEASKGRTIGNNPGAPYMVVKGKSTTDISKEEYFGAYQPEQLNQDNMFVVLRGGGDPDAYVNQLRGGAASDDRKRKPQYVFHGDDILIPKKADGNGKEAFDFDEFKSTATGDKTCLFRVGPLVWALLKGNFKKYAGILKEIYADEARKNEDVSDLDEYRRLVRDMKFRTGRDTTNLSGLQQQFLIRALFYPDLDGSQSDKDAYTQIRGAMYPIGAGKLADGTNRKDTKNSKMAPSLLLRARDRADTIPFLGSQELKAFFPKIPPKEITIDGTNVKLDDLPNRGDILLGHMYGRPIIEKDGKYTVDISKDTITAPIDPERKLEALDSLEKFTTLLKDPEAGVDSTNNTLTATATTFVNMARAVAYLQRFVPPPTENQTYPGVTPQWTSNQEIY